MRNSRAFIALIGVCCAAFCAVSRAAIDGTDLPTRYAGFSVAVQTNQTGYGNAHTSTINNSITNGSELDALYVTADTDSLWIGITGNLPAVTANGESMVIFLQTVDGGASGLSNVLDLSALPGAYGGFESTKSFNGVVFDAAFIPDKIVTINRSYDGTTAQTYANAWDLTTVPPAEFTYNAGWINQTPSAPCAIIDDCVNANACAISAYIDATNLVGVDDDETKDGAQQTTLAAGAVKGLRVRLSRNCFSIGDTIKIMVAIASPDHTISNQFLPSLTNGVDPPAPFCYPNQTEAVPNLDTMPGNQYAAVDLTAAGHNAAPNLSAGGGLGSGTDNIPAQWGGVANVVATQSIHTCFGNAQTGSVQVSTPGSELDQLFLRNADAFDGDYLHLAFTGNLENNFNRIYMFVDSKTGGENPLADTNGGDQMSMWNGRGFDAGFLPDFCYVLGIGGGTAYFDLYDISANSKTFLGSAPVNSVGGTLAGGTNGNNDLFAMNNTNVLGVDGTGGSGDPLTATTGLEARISMAELGVDLSTGTHCADVKVMVILGNGSGEYLSNQCLPGFAPNTGNINNDPTTKFNFGGADTRFAGLQFATYTAHRLGDMTGGCCINGADIAKFVQVVTGVETDPVMKFRADMNQDGVNNGTDVVPFVTKMLSPAACP